VETLDTVRDLLAEGLTYVQVGKRLEAFRPRPVVADVAPDSDAPATTALGPSLRDATRFAPAVTVLADTLHTVADGQQLLLHSQQSNRDLLTVVLRDNFSLKEENAKLRDRMLELERNLAEVRRLEATRRETMESRLAQLELRAVREPARVESARRSGCLTLGLGLFR
jgi:hypothetical protein